MGTDPSVRILTVQHLARTGLLVLILLMAALPRLLLAQTSCSSPSPECVEVGRLNISASFGVGHRSNPIAGKSDIPLVVIPQISFYAKRFFIENLELGFTLTESDSSTFSLIGAPGYDRVFFYRNDLQNIFVVASGGGGGGFTVAPRPPRTDVDVQSQEFEVGPRRTTYMVGPEWTFERGPFVGQLNALREVTGRHDGTEVRAALAASLLRSKGSLVASAGATWKSSEVVRYYYGVENLYQPGSALSPFVKLRYALPLSDRWTVNAFAHYERLPNSIANSPIVADSHVTTFFAGVVLRVR